MYKRSVKIEQSAMVSLNGRYYEFLKGQVATLDFGNYNQYRHLVIAGLCEPTDDIVDTGAQAEAPAVVVKPLHVAAPTEVARIVPAVAEEVKVEACAKTEDDVSEVVQESAAPVAEEVGAVKGKKNKKA